MTLCTGKVWSNECHHDSFSKRTEASEVSSVSTWNVSCSIGNYKLRFISSFQFALNSTQVTKYGCICPASWHLCPPKYPAISDGGPHNAGFSPFLLCENPETVLCGCFEYFGLWLGKV